MQRGLFIFGLSGWSRGADQVIEGAQRGLGALTDGNHDLLVRHSRHVTGSEHTRDRGFTTRVDNDFAAWRQLDGAFEPVGIRQQTDLYKDAFQLNRDLFTVHTVLVAQAVDLLTVASGFGGLSVGDHGHVRQAVQLALQHGVCTQLHVKLQQRYVSHDTGQVDGRFHARVTTADHGNALALEQRAVTVRAVRHALVGIAVRPGRSFRASERRSQESPTWL